MINTDRAARRVNGIGFDGVISSPKNFTGNLLMSLHCQVVSGEIAIINMLRRVSDESYQHPIIAAP